MEVTASKESDEDEVRFVRLTKSVGEPFGFKISSNPGVRGVTISAITPGGVAARTAQLAVGDYLLKVCITTTQGAPCVDCFFMTLLFLLNVFLFVSYFHGQLGKCKSLLILILSPVHALAIPIMLRSILMLC